METMFCDDVRDETGDDIGCCRVCHYDPWGELSAGTLIDGRRFLVCCTVLKALEAHRLVAAKRGE